MSDRVALISAAFALVLVELHGPEGQHIEINPEQVVALRAPRSEGSESHFHKDVKCLVFTSDGKFTSVIETCEEVILKLEATR